MTARWATAAPLAHAAILPTMAEYEIPDMPHLLTTAQVAEIIGCTPNTVIQWAELGRHGFPQPAIQGGPGSANRWHPDDIRDWLNRIRTR